MSQKLINLSADEKEKLEKFYLKSKKQVLVNSLAVGAGLIVFSFIPTGILRAFSSNDTGSDNSNPRLSIIQDMGFGGWLIAFIILMGLIVFAYITTKKIFPLKKDTQEAQKIEVDVEVTKKFVDDKDKNYCIWVTGGSLQKQKIVLEREQVNNYNVGQKMRIEVYKNSRMLVS